MDASCNAANRNYYATIAGNYGGSYADQTPMSHPLSLLGEDRHLQEDITFDILAYAKVFH